MTLFRRLAQRRNRLFWQRLQLRREAIAQKWRDGVELLSRLT